MIWVRGQVVADLALSISVLDRTFEHGLGLFETLRTWNGHPTLLPRHLDRLSRSAAELGLPLDQADLPDAEAVADLLRTEGRSGDASLRITLSRRDLPHAGLDTLDARRSPCPRRFPRTVRRSAHSGPCDSDSLVGYKTLNYWSNRLMYENAQNGGFDECVTISADGQLWEGSRTNLFVVADRQLLTPPCAGRVLPGIMRSLILERAGRLDLDVRETPLSLFDRLFQPDEVFLSNSVRGIMAVGRWGEARFPAPGPITRRLWEDILPWLESGGTT